MQISNSIIQLSWSKINLFLQCRRCFYKEIVLRKKRPVFDSDFFSLNNVVDELWKNEFDLYRTKKIAHPIMTAHQIEAVPLAHEFLYLWRDYRTGGIRAIDRATGIELFGIIDDIWINAKRELIIIDYKTTAKQIQSPSLNKESKCNITNQRQMAFYANLFKRNGYKVHDTGYFIYSIALKNKSMFNQRVEFHSMMQSYLIDDSWVEETIKNVRRCLDLKVIPDSAEDCNFCNFLLE